MTIQTQEKLAKINNLEEERYIDSVKINVRKEYFPEDELAILRKCLFSVTNILENIIGGNIMDKDIEEFRKYNIDVEKIKSHLKVN